MGCASSPFLLEGAVRANQGEVYAEQPKITPGYFSAMGIRPIAGRDFTWRDAPAAEPVAIVSQGLADAYWPGQNAMGKRLQIDDRLWRTIVGIVEDVRHDGLDRPPRPTIYIPFAQYPRPMMALLVRSDGDPLSLIAPLRQAVLSVDRKQPLFGVQTMEQTLAASLSTRRFLMVLTAIFAIIAAALGTIGIYGVLAYFVGQRRQELAVRAALGASGSHVVWLVLKEGAFVAIPGVGLGLLASAALSGVVSGLLFGVSPVDPVTFATMPLLLIGFVVAAAYLPARRVARLDPVTALRGE